MNYIIETERQKLRADNGRRYHKILDFLAHIPYIIKWDIPQNTLSMMDESMKNFKG